jgi:hypothetical protein
VLAVLIDKCQRCHSDPPALGVPVPLTSYDDTQVPVPAANDEPVWQVMGQYLDVDAMPPNPPYLTAMEKTTLLDWIEAGAPPGDGGCP